MTSTVEHPAADQPAAHAAHSASEDVQVLPVFIDDEYRPEGALRQTLGMIEIAWRVAEACPDAVRLCRTGDDIRAALPDGIGAMCTDHVRELATRPVVASHSSSFALRGHHRNLTDDRMRAIARNGGVIGINLLAQFIDEDRHTVARAVDHIEHAVSVAGADHVGLGPDLIQTVSDGLACPDDLASGAVRPRGRIPGLEGPAGLPLITDELLRRGWPDAQVQQVLGLNFQRLLVEQLGVSGASGAPGVSGVPGVSGEVTR